jgi:hypothetical protein
VCRGPHTPSEQSPAQPAACNPPGVSHSNAKVPPCAISCPMGPGLALQQLSPPRDGPIFIDLAELSSHVMHTVYSDVRLHIVHQAGPSPGRLGLPWPPCRPLPTRPAQESLKQINNMHSLATILRKFSAWAAASEDRNAAAGSTHASPGRICLQTCRSVLLCQVAHTSHSLAVLVPQELLSQ